jgi:hypothetical protein
VIAPRVTMKPVAVVGAAAIGEHGTGWRGLGEAALALSIGTFVKLPGLPPEEPLAQPKARKMMSRGAYLAARCLADLLADITWRRANVGYFLGVGASGGSLQDVTALLEASIENGNFSLERFGDRGLAACNPLLAFQLMNNFTLCHGAILEGIGGPNSALFSRGAGTTAALIEAVHAISDGDCDHAIAGGADSATHPVTHAELTRDGFLARGMRPTEGAALIALGVGNTGARTLGVVEHAALARGSEEIDAIVAHARMTDLGSPWSGIDLVVLAPWCASVGDELAALVKRRAPAALIVDASLALGDCLAASPALAWVAALDMLVAGHGTRALVIGAGTDGDFGIALLAKGDA